jgi:hypothetical protein
MNPKKFAIQRERTPKDRLVMKRRLVNYLGGKCIDCGYSTHLAALDFDHIEPSKKLYNISRLITQLDYLDLLEEVKKCVLRCANCHRVRTNPQAHI